jgi:hypothetical protein
MVPAEPGGDLFLYNWRNPRPKDALEARVLAFYRALGGERRGGRPGALERGPFGLCRWVGSISLTLTVSIVPMTFEIKIYSVV